MMPLIKDAKPSGYELYNLASDRSQETNLAESEPQRTARMAKRLGEIWRDVQTEGPDWRKSSD